MSRTAESIVSRPGTSSDVYTPFTPRMRQRQRFDLSTRPEEDEETDITGLANLVGQSWNIYSISALFGFQRDDTHLKLYSKKLREKIASTLSRENVTYNAKFSIMEDIALIPNHEDHPAIKIEVLAKNNTRQEDAEKSIYKGLLLSWSIRQVKVNIENCIRLPLLLCRGTRSCTDAVHNIIGCMFDCLVTALIADEDDLSWFIPIIIMPTREDEESPVSGEVQMEYIIPELPLTDTITVKFQTSNLNNILSAIIKNQNDMVNTFLKLEHIEIFYEVLHTQMLRLGGVQLGLCTLHKINLPGITIMGNKMKVMNEEIMNRILLYLNEKALNTFHILGFDT